MRSSAKMNVFAVLSILLGFCFVTSAAFEKVTTFRCDENNQQISPIMDNSTGIFEAEGRDIRICFKTTPRASSDGVYLLKIDDFTFTKERSIGDLAAAGPTRTIPEIIRQMAIDHGTPISWDLTDIFCNPGDSICAFETTLTGYFFLTGGTIHGKGRVMTQRGRERRELQDIDTFENVFLDLEFLADGKVYEPVDTVNTVLITLFAILLLLLICCCCCLGFFFKSFCCLWCPCVDSDEEETRTKEVEVGTRKNDSDDDYDDVESVPVSLGWNEDSKPSSDIKKLKEKSSRTTASGVADDVSETESLEDDQYWDDMIAEEEDEEDQETKKKKPKKERSRRR